MTTEVKDKLVEIIQEANSIPEANASGNTHTFRVGYALQQLGKDLAATNKPLKVSYADLQAFDVALKEATKDTDCGFGISHGPKEWALQSYVSRLRTAFDAAVDAGVLVTQDRAMERIR